MRRKQPIPAALRLQVIDRDNGRCRACGIGDRDALQADHITPESKGGKTTLDNLQALCGVCNNRKQNTVVELDIRPAVEGFGDYAEVMQARTDFLETLANVRQAEVRRLEGLVKAWREANVRGCIIRNRLEKMVDKRKVEKILRSTR